MAKDSIKKALWVGFVIITVVIIFVLILAYIKLTDLNKGYTEEQEVNNGEKPSCIIFRSKEARDSILSLDSFPSVVGW